MFGRQWEHGQARIVAMQRDTGLNQRANANSGFAYDCVVDVVPEGPAAPFRATFTLHCGFDVDGVPTVGEELRVKFRDGEVRPEPASLRAVEQARKDARQQRFDTAAAAPPATPTPTVRVTTSTDPADLERMRERFERLAAERPESVVRFTAGPPPSPADDTVSRLERLAALRDRGVLSDGEFEAEKAKILRDG